MPSIIRRTGQDIKRSILRLEREVAPKSKKAFYNARLNWKEFWQGRLKLWSYPRHIQVGTNLTCNLRCIFCRRQHPDEHKRLTTIPPGEREMPESVITKLLRIAPFADIVNITPYGDPLLFTRLRDFLKRYQHLRCNNLALTTNGALLDDGLAELLVRSGLTILFFSIDSCTPDNYRQLRLGAELSSVVEGIKRIIEWKTRLRASTPHVYLATTLMRRNIEELPAMIEFCRDNQIEEISVQMMEVEVPEMEPESLKHFRNLAQSMVSLARTRAKALGVRFNLHLALQNLFMQTRQSAAPDPPRYPADVTLTKLCHYPWYFIYIDTNGDIRPCCYASVCWGNLKEQPFQAIWNGEKAIRMRRMFLENIVPLSCQEKHCAVDTVIPSLEQG